MPEDRRISELLEAIQTSGGDLLVIVDISETEECKKTKKITVKNLMGSPGPIGNVSPSSGKFLTFELGSGSTISTISSDGNLIGNSNFTIVTEKAIKSYVDNNIFSFKVKFTSVNTTAESGDVVLVNSSSGDIGIFLTPSSNGKIIIKKISSDSNKVFITVVGGGKIDNRENKIIKDENVSYFFVSDGSDFYII